MDVLRQHGSFRNSDIGIESRKAEEAATRRYEAASFLRRTVGVLCAKYLPNEPSEEEFRRGVRSGFILCNALNKVQPGAVPKVIESSGDSVAIPEDGTALSAYQYFENIRNFFVAVQEIGLPMFEASDLEEGGKTARVVNCVLALKSYSEWKQAGGNGSWKFGGSLKPVSTGKFFARNHSEQFLDSSSRNLYSDHNSNGTSCPHDTEKTASRSLNTLVRAVFSDKKPEEIPMLLESILNKVMEEFDGRKASQNELVKTTLKNQPDVNKFSSKRKVLSELATAPVDTKVGDENSAHVEDHVIGKPNNEEAKIKPAKQILIYDKQQKLIEELKHAIFTTRTGMQYMQIKYSEEFCSLGKHLQSLAHAAAGYHKVLEENRKLYNQVQDLKGNIRVYCRVRPFLPGHSSPMSSVGSFDDGTISIITPTKYGKDCNKSFSFNKVFGPSATQDEVFLDTRPLIRSVLDGYNACIFAYGQTGSGKTYTMTGPKELTSESQGVNYRALSDLFHLSKHRRDAYCYDISVQMIEIYNEQVRDLLASNGLNKRLEIRNSSQTGLNVPDANVVSVSSTSDVIELMNIGQRNRAVGATALNDRSSRSHSCLTVHVQGRELASGTIFHGCMHLVDLAGSERVNKSEVTGERLKEAQHINKSLSALGDVIAALAQKNSHVPYRNSKLTQLLQDSLGGQAKTLMFVHISPEINAIGETISTLKFAERVSSVELGAARINKESMDVKELKEQIARLKEALANRDGGTGLHTPSVGTPCFQTPSSEMFKLKASTPSSLHSNQESGSVRQINHGCIMEVQENVEARSYHALRGKKPSFDLQELLPANDSPPWADSHAKVDEKVITYQEWVDKIMVNKQEIREYDTINDLQGEAPQLPESFYQRFLPDARGFTEQQFNGNGISRKESQEFDSQRVRTELAATDDPDEFEIATSTSSESDLLWQCSNNKIATALNISGSRLRKPQPRLPPLKSPEIRTPIRPHGPLSSRKILTSSSKTPNRAVHQPNDVKRQSSNGKLGSRK